MDVCCVFLNSDIIEVLVVSQNDEISPNQERLSQTKTFSTFLKMFLNIF